MEFEILLSGLKFPEGPSFDRQGNLWFVEIHGGNLGMYDGGRVHRFDVNGIPNGSVYGNDGLAWFCDSGNGQIRTFNPATSKFETVCQTANGNPLIRPNDLIFDSRGNLLFTDHADGRTEPVSTVCMLPKGKSDAVILSSGKYFTNGLALKNNGELLCFSETYKQRVWIADYEQNENSLINEKVFAETNHGDFGPDGIAFDKFGNLFVTIFDEQVIKIYNPRGEVADSIKTPGKRPTSCAFDPFGKYGLVVTEADRGEIINYPQYKNAGLPVY